MAIIFNVPVRNFGKLLKDCRLATIDPTTGRRYTQARVAEEVARRTGETSLSRSSVAGWEAGDPAEPQVKYVNALIEMGILDGLEAVQALGFKVDNHPLGDKERKLLAAHRRLRRWPSLQDTGIRLVQALLPPQDYESPVSGSEGRGNQEGAA